MLGTISSFERYHQIGKYNMLSVADLGGGAVADAFLPSGIWPPADPKGPLLVFLRNPFLADRL